MRFKPGQVTHYTAVGLQYAENYRTINYIRTAHKHSKQRNLEISINLVTRE